MYYPAIVIMDPVQLLLSSRALVRTAHICHLSSNSMKVYNHPAIGFQASCSATAPTSVSTARFQPAAALVLLPVPTSALQQDLHSTVLAPPPLPSVSQEALRHPLRTPSEVISVVHAKATRVKRKLLYLSSSRVRRFPLPVRVTLFRTPVLVRAPALVRLAGKKRMNIKLTYL